MSEDALARGAAASGAPPVELASARGHAAGFEDRAVRSLLSMLGDEEQAAALRAEAKRRGARALSFALLHEVVEGLPLVFRAARLRFDFRAGPTSLMNGVEDTPMWDAWREAREELFEELRPVVLVFSWPALVASDRGLAVLHDVPPMGPWIGTRLVRYVADRCVVIETLPSFLLACGLLADRERWEKRARKGGRDR